MKINIDTHFHNTFDQKIKCTYRGQSGLLDFFVTDIIRVEFGN